MNKHKSRDASKAASRLSKRKLRKLLHEAVVTYLEGGGKLRGNARITLITPYQKGKPLV